MSGAGMYISGPMCRLRPLVNERMITCFISGLMEAESQQMPDLPPPKGTPIRAVFHVISIARPTTSSRLTEGVMRIPPLAGPKVLL